MRFIWASRGAKWGFRFLSSAGLADPLPVYEAAFGAVGDNPEVIRKSINSVALRFDDPLQRRDQAGRIIPHEFVLFVDPTLVRSLDDGRHLIWPEVAGRFARIWNEEEPSGSDSYAPDSRS